MRFFIGSLRGMITPSLIVLSLAVAGPLSAGAPAWIDADTVELTVDRLAQQHGDAELEKIRRGVHQAARLWRSEDGDRKSFTRFCADRYVADPDEKRRLFEKLSRNLEILRGHFNRITLDLQKPLHLDGGELHAIDHMFAAYDASAHLTDDLYSNKIAFIVALNFPFYSTEEKDERAKEWSRLDWAYARMGDQFVARVPAALQQAFARVNTAADAYISEYNIYAGRLLAGNGERPFPEGKILLTHWNLRDEIKAGYSVEKGIKKQQLLYAVMKRIIDQTIPQIVINSGKVEWDPVGNRVLEEGNPIPWQRESDTRYLHLLNSFKALQAMDGYYPEGLNSAVKRGFSGAMEIPQASVEKLFVKYLSSPVLKRVARLIEKRLKRKLRPFDVWYNGFGSGSGIPEDRLDDVVNQRYPTADAMDEDIVNILQSLGFPEKRAVFLSDRIVVQDARGSGHAWGPEMRTEKAHLRTRVPDDGMNYKGYNIAVHELGHNVEQILSLYSVDHYMLNGVPNTAFTEALAFMFQERDMEILGLKQPDPKKAYLDALNTCWSAYEIMGVSLVDMRIWKWLYAHPGATPTQLREAVLAISKNVWNTYYADVFGGIRDEPVLAIYSHIIAYPLYLSAYAYGELIKFQLQEYVSHRDFAGEIERIYTLGRLTPHHWMKRAVGSGITIEPILTAAASALSRMK